MTKYVVFDATNMLYRSYFANRDETEQDKAGLAHRNALLTLNKYFKQFKPDRTVLLFDRPNWRKPYTKSDLCLSGKLYKGGRRKNQTPSDKLKFEQFVAHIHEFENMMKKHTKVVCLSQNLLEADDLAGGFVQRFADESNEIIMVSADKDYIQLLGHPNVRLIDPATGKDRTLDEWEGDAELFIFEKCIRGENGSSGDNIQSAFPRVRKTRIFKAYHDSYERTNFMNESWTDQRGKLMFVGELFEENKLLMDLNAQPPEIKEIIQQTITDGMDNTGSFSHFHFLGFCGKFGMKELAATVDQFVPLLNS